MWIATGGYCGFFPLAPGTVGSAVAIFPAFLLSLVPASVGWVLLGIVCLVSVWAADRAETISGCDDPGFIVIDEIAGMMVTLFGHPFTIGIVLVGFFLFRILDVLKPFPIGFLESKVPGGAGVVVDDVAAGILGNGLLHVAVMCRLL